MSRDIHALIYVSHSNHALKDAATDAVIQDILATSRTKNASLSVTGALLFSESCFSQVLEGDESALRMILESIRVDARHRDVTLLSFRQVPQRRFLGWSMAYAGVSAGPIWMAKIEGVLVTPSVINSDRLGDELLEFMTDLIRQQELDRRGPPA